MVKEQVLKALRSLGFMPEEIKDFGYSFDYDGLTLIYTLDDEDSMCITLAAPDVFDISDNNRTEVLEGMVKLCGDMNYVQPYIVFEDQVWLCCQHYTDGKEVTATLLEHMINVLAFSTIKFRRIMNGDDNDD